MNELAQWYNIPANKKKIDIVAINLDETQAAEQRWKTAIAATPEWKCFYVKEGVNSPVAADYAILSTPVMFLLESENNIIMSVPDDFAQLIKGLNELLPL